MSATTPSPNAGEPPAASETSKHAQETTSKLLDGFLKTENDLRAFLLYFLLVVVVLAGFMFSMAKWGADNQFNRGLTLMIGFIILAYVIAPFGLIFHLPEAPAAPRPAAKPTPTTSKAASEAPATEANPQGDSEGPPSKDRSRRRFAVLWFLAVCCFLLAMASLLLFIPEYHNNVKSNQGFEHSNFDIEQGHSDEDTSKDASGEHAEDSNNAEEAREPGQVEQGTDGPAGLNTTPAENAWELAGSNSDFSTPSPGENERTNETASTVGAETQDLNGATLLTGKGQQFEAEDTGQRTREETPDRMDSRTAPVDEEQPEKRLDLKNKTTQGDWAEPPRTRWQVWSDFWYEVLSYVPRKVHSLFTGKNKEETKAGNKKENKRVKQRLRKRKKRINPIDEPVLKELLEEARWYASKSENTAAQRNDKSKFREQVAGLLGRNKRNKGNARNIQSTAAATFDGCIRMPDNWPNRRAPQDRAVANLLQSLDADLRYTEALSHLVDGMCLPASARIIFNDDIDAAKASGAALEDQLSRPNPDQEALAQAVADFKEKQRKLNFDIESLTSSGGQTLGGRTPAKAASRQAQLKVELDNTLEALGKQMQAHGNNGDWVQPLADVEAQVDALNELLSDLPALDVYATNPKAAGAQRLTDALDRVEHATAAALSSINKALRAPNASPESILAATGGGGQSAREATPEDTLMETTAWVLENKFHHVTEFRLRFHESKDKLATNMFSGITFSPDYALTWVEEGRVLEMDAIRPKDDVFEPCLRDEDFLHATIAFSQSLSAEPLADYLDIEMRSCNFEFDPFVFNNVRYTRFSAVTPFAPVPKQRGWAFDYNGLLRMEQRQMFCEVNDYNGSFDKLKEADKLPGYELTRGQPKTVYHKQSSDRFCVYTTHEKTGVRVLRTFARAPTDSLVAWMDDVFVRDSMSLVKETGVLATMRQASQANRRDLVLSNANTRSGNPAWSCEASILFISGEVKFVFDQVFWNGYRIESYKLDDQKRIFLQLNKRLNPWMNSVLDVVGNNGYPRFEF